MRLHRVPLLITTTRLIGFDICITGICNYASSIFQQPAPTAYKVPRKIDNTTDVHSPCLIFEAFQGKYRLTNMIIIH